MHSKNIGEVMRLLKSIRGLSSKFAEWAFEIKREIVGDNGRSSPFLANSLVTRVPHILLWQLLRSSFLRIFEMEMVQQVDQRINIKFLQ